MTHAVNANRLALKHRPTVAAAAEVALNAADILDTIDLRTYYGAAKYPTKREILILISELHVLAARCNNLIEQAEDRDDMLGQPLPIRMRR